MNTPKEVKVLEQVCKEAKAKGKVTDKHIEQLSEALGSRFTKAWDTVKGEGVKKYVFSPSGRIVWIVVGREREYQIMPAAGFCSCDDFYFRVMFDIRPILFFGIIGTVLGGMGLFLHYVTLPVELVSIVFPFIFIIGGLLLFWLGFVTVLARKLRKRN